MHFDFRDLIKKLVQFIITVAKYFTKPTQSSQVIIKINFIPPSLSLADILLQIP